MKTIAFMLLIVNILITVIVSIIEAVRLTKVVGGKFKIK